MQVLVSGSSGLVGSALVAALEGAGHAVVRLVRRTPAANEIRLDSGAPEGFDAVVHLAGESIAGRWTAAKKAAIRDSRVQGTSTLATALARTPRPPKVMVCASAIGIYGDCGDETFWQPHRCSRTEPDTCALGNAFALIEGHPLPCADQGHRRQFWS
ncbi:MAG: NAD-dependent epimerase/dehydratase family protein [Terriglobales bacterium]